MGVLAQACNVANDLAVVVGGSRGCLGGRQVTLLLWLSACKGVAGT